MTEALRRLFWSVPVLVSFAALLFLLVGQLPSVRAELHYPLFYNSTPQNAERAARQALRATLSQDADAEFTLGRLGGSALPTVLKELPRLSVTQRREVALALAPAALRMGLRTEQWHTPSTRVEGKPARLADEELLLWQRYQNIHASDLKPLAVERLVRRITERRSQLRERDLIAIDTYALDPLIEQLGRMDEPSDVARAARLVPHVARALERDWQLSRSASLEQARALCTEIRRHWDVVGPAYTHLNQVETLLSHLTQTELGLWLARSFRELTGLDTSELFPALLLRGTESLPRLLVTLLGLVLVGPLIAATIQVVQLGERRWRIERFGLRIGLGAAAALGLSLVLSPQDPASAAPLFSCFAMGTATSGFILHRELNDRLDWRSHHVLRRRGPSARILAVAGWLGPSIPTFLPMVVTEAVLWMVCVESLSGGTGLGLLATQALVEGDYPALMALSLGLVVLTGSVQVLSDLLVGNLPLRRGVLQ